MKQRIVIDLYDHTPTSEVAEILDSLRGIGIDGARFEQQVGNDEKGSDLAGWRQVGGWIADPDTGAIVWTQYDSIVAAAGEARA